MRVLIIEDDLDIATNLYEFLESKGNVADLARDGVDEAELTKAKNKVLSALVIKNELSMGRLVDLGFNWMYLGQYRPIDDDVEAIKAVTVDEVNTLIRQLDLGSFTQFTLGPV